MEWFTYVKTFEFKYVTGNFFWLLTLDLELQWDGEDRKDISVPMTIYERACVSNSKEGVEV